MYKLLSQKYGLLKENSAILLKQCLKYLLNFNKDLMNIYKATNLKAERRRYILKRSNKSIYYMLKTCLKNKEQEIYQ